MENEAATAIVVRMRDEASQKLEQFGSKVKQTHVNLQRLGMQFTIVGGAITAMMVLAAKAADKNGEMAASIERVRQEMGVLVEKIGTAVLPMVLNFLEVIKNVFAVVNLIPTPLVQIGAVLGTIGGVMLTVAGSVLMFVNTLKSLGITLAFVKSLALGPVGILSAVAALGVAAGVSAALASYEHGGQVPGPAGQAQLAVVHGGETILPAGRLQPAMATILPISRLQPAAATVNINIGHYYGDDTSRRELARDIHRIIREESRLRAVGRNP